MLQWTRPADVMRPRMLLLQVSIIEGSPGHHGHAKAEVQSTQPSYYILQLSAGLAYLCTLCRSVSMTQ
jgi:hypothetical protein